MRQGIAFLLLIVSILFYSCKKNNPKPDKTQTHLSTFSIEPRYVRSPDFEIPAPETNNPTEITYTSSDTSVAVIKGKSIQIKKAGTVEITASQQGNDKYEPGTIKTIFTIMPNVYISGYVYDSEGYIPVFWKNGELNQLEPRAIASDIFATGDDLYISATINEGSYGTAAYWKNGKLVRLPGGAANTRAIAAVGNDVIVTGLLINPTPLETYVNVVWKNGQLLNLERPFGCCTDRDKLQPTVLAVDESKIYICGTAANEQTQFPVIWNSDGSLYKVFQSPQTNYISQAIVKDGNFYLSGSSGFLEDLTYWKNSQKYAQPNESRNNVGFNTIAVKNGDVYTGAPDANNGAYWKNGVKTIVSDQSSVIKIAISGDDLHMVGVRYLSNSLYDYEAVYWLNGKISRLAGPKSSQALAMTVVDQ
ncbi:hypothetical protein LT679_10350 [Mucilaginibacter roseus]|uniref:BIG2 domain-containing protein n=1 Tax=Mucilaginibacter roseus TaxID=1528868 RepID=A0ABS8U595_9SPHI|nr:hypothetical protein [Mucilaginibacter roseus]MCD8741002.1 hypothetical protein [Mucilaginibacter roseus]